MATNRTDIDAETYIRNLRAEIVKRTGYDVGPDDPIFPIIACQQLMCRELSFEIAERDIARLARIRDEILAKLKEHEKMLRQNRMFIIGSAALAVFVNIIAIILILILK